MFDMTVTPGNKFVKLAKDVVSALLSVVTVRLSFAEKEPPQLWRLVSVGCANDTALCARPTSTVAMADINRRWQITRSAAQIEASGRVQDKGWQQPSVPHVTQSSPHEATGWPLLLPECLRFCLSALTST